MTSLCHLRTQKQAHTGFCRCLRVSKGALFHFWEGSEAGTKLGFRKGMGIDIRVPLPRTCPQRSPPGSHPMPVVTGGLRVFAGSGWGWCSEQLWPRPTHTPPSAYLKQTLKGEL